MTGLLCHPNGKTLYVSDFSNHRIRKIDLTTLVVTTVAGDGKRETYDGMSSCIDYSKQLVFDRSWNAKPYEVLLIASYRMLLRFDTETGVISTPQFRTSIGFNTWATAYTPSGHLIVSCSATQSFYSMDVSTGDVVAICGTGKAGFADGIGLAAKFHSVVGLVLNEREQCLYACDHDNNRIRRITLPP